MYLKKIYIQGFKSFADKTEIKFNNEITAIIGPNGSGKSNISDAVRWVLGEQSIKSLRGSKMEDVIFSGTDRRKALGFAEVSIVFDNKDKTIPLDYSEVSITRRMFRSGESEYFINKNACRLKDIRELLMDTGVGKEGYSIIGQGKIDEILSTKPVDRRGIFEEAAGIVKFKNKKIESERKLEKTQSNILRIEDLIYEVENQRDQVEKEANKTEQFNKLYIKLKELEVNQFIKDINRLNNELDKLNLQETKLKEQTKGLAYHKKSIEDKYEGLKEQIKRKEDLIEDARNIKFTAIQDFEKNKNQLSLFKEKGNYLNNEINRLRDYNSDVCEKLKNLEEDKKRIKNELERLKIQMNDFLYISNSEKDNLEGFKEKIKNLELDLDREKDELLSLYNIISDKRSERNSGVNFIEIIDNRINDIHKEIEEINTRKNNIEKDLSDLSQTYQSLNLDLQENIIKLDISNSSYENLSTELEDINDNINSCKISLNGLNSSHSLISNMEKKYDGYYNSVRNFLKSIKNNSKVKEGFLGVVADLVQVKDIYIKALEISLGGNAQNIVVENENNAKNMIEFLKNNKIGRVTFLPKNTIKGSSINLNDRLKKEYNIIGLAHELVDYDKSIENIIKHLLGRIIIIKDMDSAIEYSRISNYRYRVVTLDGQVFNPGGSITGGSMADNRISILSRKNKLDSLGKEIEIGNNSLKVFLKTKEKTIQKLKEVEIKKLNITRNIEDAKINLSNTKNEIENNNNYIDKLNQDYKKKDIEIKTLSTESKILKQNQDNIIKAITHMEEEEIKIKTNIEAKNGILKGKKEQLSLLISEQTDRTIRINSLRNKINNLEEKLFDISSNNESLINSRAKNSDDIESLLDEISSLDKKKEKIELYQNNHEKEEEELSYNLNELIKSKDQLMHTFYQEQDNLKIINDEMSKLEKNINSIHVKSARYDVENTSILEKLYDEYNLDFNQALKYEKDFPDFKDAKNKIKYFKEEIKKIGNVNINALEEFKAINERYHFITKQYEDLINSREDLNLVIRDMDRHMKSLFIKNFDIINRNFKKVFTILFDGGFAELELEDKSDVLESGIDIKVQPPGKKLQYLNLLSGGEKSLTAVALLFAILRTKPAPFCILDEIDAALDESNITRYINYLKNFSDFTQFILITHRKTTMEIADVLYGVTMEEQGISKLISVKLNDEVVAS